ncbi:hypothetical protein Tco_0602955 [Tanacetum coccineum]
MTTVGTRAVVNTGKGKLDTNLIKSRWVWRPKGNYLDHVSKDSRSFMLKKVEYVDPKGISMSVMAWIPKDSRNFLCRQFRGCLLQDHAMVDSSCSSHMTGNKAYLSELKDSIEALWHELNFKLLDESPKFVLRTPRKMMWYLLGYFYLIKAFRVYNKRTKRVEENLHINFLEDQPNVAGTGPNWMFDLDFLTNSMNYIPVSVENQVNVDAGTQDSYVAGSSGKDKGPTQEYILLPLQPHRTRIPIEDVAPVAHETPSESSPKENDVQDSEDAANKESEQDLQDELEKMVTQELAAKAMDDVSRQAFEEEKRRIASQKKAAQATSTNKLSTDRPSVSTDRPSVSTDRPFVSTDRSNTPYVSAASTSTGANAGESSFVYLGGKIPNMLTALLNADLPNAPNILTADFTNMYNAIAISPIPTLRIH